MKLLKDRQFNEFIVAFARLAKLDLRTTKRIILDKSCEGLAIASRAQGYDRNSFSSFVLLTNQVSGRDERIAHRVIELYDQLPPQTAQRTMRFWAIRSQTAMGSKAA